jgi:hypothetical protein
MKSIIDNEGNINISLLEKELKNALEFDTKYKQTDNMKKRACKVATDYNEFKAMVSCAHLKTLSKEEVESLSQVKKGWKKASSTVATSKAPKTLLKEKKNNEQQNLLQSLETVPIQNLKKPKTVLELERDLRRILDDSDKLKF